MCRHAAYAGPGITLNELMRDPPHSLLHQSYAPRELLSGVVCADGFGVGWYNPEEGETAARLVAAHPIWSDPSLPTLGDAVRAGIVLGAVRNGTLEAAPNAADAAPFVDGAWLWSLNGALDAFTTHWRTWLLQEETAMERWSRIQGRTDAEHLFHAFLSRLEEPDVSPADAPKVLHTFLRHVLTHAEAEGLACQLNILASDGTRVYASRAGTQKEQNSLYLLQDGREFPGGIVVASEPLDDDPGWTTVAPDTLLVLQAGAPPVRMRI